MAKLILKNGRNYGDASKYKDLLSKPTINTHLVEGDEATSSSLDIFKYIGIEEYGDLLLKNPYAVYAVCDEKNFIRNYFIHGSKTYCFTDYFQVTELPETGDPTVLYYLIKNTDAYGMGTWFWTETEPGTYGYVNIGAPDVDSKTVFIVPETGELNTQVGGYIIDNDELIEKSLITNKMPSKCFLSEDGKYTILEFNYDYYFHYTPATVYKMALNFSGDVIRSELFPTDTMGTNDIIFGEDKLTMCLKAGIYNSLEPNQYHLSLSWMEPQHISPINKIFLDIDDETISWVNGEMHTDIVQNAYTSINKLDDYLYSVYYNNMDYPGADKFFTTNPALSILGGCATVHTGDLTGRVYDNFYDESVEFVVQTPNRVGRYATIGIASSIEGLTRNTVGNGEYSEMYEILPFMISEGINEHGVVVTSHIIKADKEVGTFIRPEAEKEITLNSNAIPRYLLDNCKSAGEAVMQLRDHVLTKVNQGLLNEGYVQAYIICDRNASYCVQLIEESYTITTSSYLTDFYLWGTTPNIDGDPFFTPETGDATSNGVTLHGQGLERYNSIAAVYDAINNRAAMFEIIRELNYEKVYSEDTRLSDWCWLDDVQVNTPASDILANTEVQRLKNAYTSRSRDPEDPNYGTWHSKHKGVYNSLLKSVIITIQGIEEVEYRFSLSEDSVELSKMVLGEISNTVQDTSQNSILQILADCMWSEHRPTQINYNNETIVYGSPEIKEDYWGNKYFILSNNLNGSFYILIRVYIDENHNVLSARRYKQYFGKYEEIDPGLGSFLPVHSLVGFANSSYITFSGLNAFKIGTFDGWHGDGTIAYSTDKETWATWDGLTYVEAVQQTNGKYEIYFRGENGTTLNGTNFTMIPGNDEINLVIKGVLSTLVDINKGPNDIIFADGAFKNAFKNIEVFDISSLSFPSKIAYSMCESMFENCSKLTYIPNDFAEYIGNYGYKNAFKNTGITETPYFDNIQTIGVGAFEGCFANCGNLTTIRKIPCETLIKECYKGMFAHCDKLIKVDFNLLPSKTLADNCYESMFEGCIGLSSPIYLYATNLKPECYKNMFKDCTNIEFGEVGDIIRVPYTGTGIAATDCCLDMFAGAYGQIPEGTGTPIVNKEYRYIVKDFYFESDNPFTVEGSNLLSGRKVEYSYDNISWSNWNGSLVAPPKTNNKYTIYFKGNIVTNLTNNAFGTFKVASPTSDVDVFGNPGALVGGNSGLATYTFANLFNGCTGLRSAKNLIMPNELPSTSSHVFESMFANCSHLIETPTMDFPNTNQAGGWAYAFAKMFSGCTSLEVQPDIHINASAVSMFESMFMNCYKLSTAKKIEMEQPITAESRQLFMNMYRGCTSLTSTPSLGYNFVSSTVTEKCFQSMFLDCSSLTTIVDFPTTPTSVKSYGFYSMFENTKVSTPVVLTATPDGATHAYARMFANCKDLIIPPTLPNRGDGEAKNTYYQMFTNSGLKTPPEINGTMAEGDCQEMFMGCTDLDVPENYMFPKAFTDLTAQRAFMDMFSNCTSLTRTPKFDNVPCVPNQGFRRTFYGCTSLKLVEDFSVITSLVGGLNMSSMFEGCINLKSCPTILAPTDVTNSGYQYMFKDTGIGKPPEISATTCSYYSFQGMFKNCKNLRYPPDLYITDYNKTSAFEEMCSGCVSINWVDIGSPYRLPAVGSAVSTINHECAGMFAGNTIDAGSEMPVNGTPEIEKTYYLNKPPENLMWISSVNEGEKLNQRYEFSPDIFWCTNLDEGNWTRGGICYDPDTTKIYFYGCCAENPVVVSGDKLEKPSGNYTGVKPVGISYIQHKVGGDFEALNAANTHIYSYLFDGFTSLVQIDSGLNWDEEGLYAYTFANTGLTSLECTLPNIVRPYMYKGTFQECTQLISVADDLFAGNGISECGCTCMFAMSGIKNIPKLPTNLAATCFGGMFMYADLSDVNEITLPCLSLSDYCYYGMFKEATFNDDVVINLPASIVKTGCYQEMFMGSNITKSPIIKLGCDASNSNCYLKMFKNCKQIKIPGTIKVDEGLDVGNIGFLTEMYDGCGFVWGPENMGTPYNIFDHEVVYSGTTPMFAHNEYITTMGGCSMRTDGLIQDPNKTYWLFIADGYLTFTAPSPFEVEFAPYCSYSYNAVDWNSCHGEYTIVEATQVGTNYKLYAKLMGVTEEATHGTRVFGGNKQVSVSGGLDGFYSCAGAFKDEEYSEDNGLYSAKDLIISSDLLGQFSLQKMFKGCVNLVYPPENIGDVTSNTAISYRPKHFMEMFSGCKSLSTTVKKIATPTTASPYMYANMYEDTAILEPPEEGVKVGEDFANNCCQSMFYNCKYLLHPAKLISSGTNPQAYDHTFATMYMDCESLSVDDITDLSQYTFPEIHAPTDSTELSDSGQYAYYKTFFNCGSLRDKVCPIKTDTIANHACESMYEQCVNLKNAQGALTPKTSTATIYTIGSIPLEEVTHTFYKMFCKCTNLEVGSDALICNGVVSAWEYAYTQSGIKQTPSIKTTTGASRMYSQTFDTCVNLVNCDSMPFDIAGVISENSPYIFHSTFGFNDSLKKVPAINIDNGTGKKIADHAFEETFHYCKSLEEITFEKLEGDTQDYSFHMMCYSCESLKQIKGTNVWKINPSSESVCEYMFGDCKNLCMDYNFKITQLTAGDVQWKGVGFDAFNGMFCGCTKLYIPIEFEFEHNPAGVSYSIHTTAFKKTFADTSIIFTIGDAGGTAYILPYNTDIEGVQYGLQTFANCANYDATSGIITDSGSIMLGKIIYYDKSIPNLNEYITFDGVFSYQIHLSPGMWYRNGDNDWVRATQDVFTNAEKSEELTAEAGRDVYAVRVTHPGMRTKLYTPCFSIENNYHPSWSEQALNSHVKVYGKLSTVLNWQKYIEMDADSPDLTQYLDFQLMMGDIEDASELIMPDEIIKEVDGVTYVRYVNFYCPESLIYPPKVLPATKLYPYCYYTMFGGCTKLMHCPAFVEEWITPNELELAPYCFDGMYSHCSSITRGPILPEVEELPEGSYEYMFAYSGLEYTPSIPVSKVVKTRGCRAMFKECKELIQADIIPEATSVGKLGYYEMYKGCIKANVLPNLGHITSVGSRGMEDMFYGIKGILWNDYGGGEHSIQICAPSAQTVGYPFTNIFVDTGGTGSAPPPASGSIVPGAVYRYDSIT